MIRKIAAIAATAVAGVLLILSFTTNHCYVTTPSMYPTIPPGSEIFVSRQAEYHVGEVIEFHANGLIWAHRLIEIKPNGDYVTKGDNPQNTPDVFVPPVTKKDVVGAVTHAPKWLGFPELILHHPQYGLSWLRAELGLPGRIVLIAVAALAGLAWPAKSAQHAHARHRVQKAQKAKHPAAPAIAELDLDEAPTVTLIQSDRAALRQLLDA